MEYTENLKLFKYNPETDGKQVFSIDQALNYNWDILDKFSGVDIGDPIISLTGTLKENEIWLEGEEVSKTDYNLLYEIYQDIYGTPTNSNNFVLPDFRNRSIWGSSDATFGYQSAALPNITGTSTKAVGVNASSDGAFITARSTGSTFQGGSHNFKTLEFNASLSSPIYQTGATVTPPSLKVRVKTRYKSLFITSFKTYFN